MSAAGAAAPLRVGFVAPAWPPARAQNGIVSYVATMAASMRELGVDARVVAQYVPRELLEAVRAEGVGIVDDEPVPLARRALDAVARRRRPEEADFRRAVWRLGRALDRQLRAPGQGAARARVYEIEESFGNARLLVRQLAARQVVRLHGPWFLCAPALGLDPSAPAEARRIRWEGEAIRGAGCVTAPSRMALDATRAHYGIELPRARVIPNPIWPAEKPWRRDQARPDSILFVGRFDSLKGGDTVLEAFARVHARRPGAALTFVGPDRGAADGSSLPRFAERVLPAAARGALAYLGPQPPQRIRELRYTHAVTVVASRYETFPMTLLEAMATGAPVVASRAGGIPELLDVAPDLLFTPGDAGELAARIGWLLEDEAAAANLGALLHATCRERYHPLAIARATLDLYRELCARPVGSRTGGRA